MSVSYNYGTITNKKAAATYILAVIISGIVGGGLKQNERGKKVFSFDIAALTCKKT